jgi:peroxin-5
MCDLIVQSVLALEATVQRDPTNAAVWFGLGVKQQENEREQQAIQALERAVDLDPTHLSAWLALATSYTNDCNRSGTYHAIKQWVDRNKKLEAAVQRFRIQEPLSSSASSTERFDHLIRCLITTAQSDTSGEIDPDIQIALAVLLNTNEARCHCSTVELTNHYKC